MPYADPSLQEKKNPTEQFGDRALTDSFNLLNQIGINAPKSELRIAEVGKPKDAPTQTNPMFLDPKHDKDVSELLKKGIPAYNEGRDIDKCSTFEKLEALVYTMRDPELFGFKYITSSQNSTPKDVEETYASKQGDCDELSRVFTVLAGKLGIKDFSQFYVHFKEQDTGKEEAHAALFYADGQLMYIDPAFKSVYSFDKKYSSPEEAMKDPNS